MDASGRRRGTPICKSLLYHDLLLPFLEILDLGIASSRLRLEVHIFAWISRLQKYPSMDFLYISRVMIEPRKELYRFLPLRDQSLEHYRGSSLLDPAQG
ncbi:hypothetical protein GW17_00051898 [Ensete ventricosum]|nr:hypothetical protein GW17_00051898 [Ensete ventricosum]